MAAIVIRLDPSKLQNPDADLRYEIPGVLARRSAGLLKDNGYDYESDGDVMQIYLLTPDLARAVPEVVSFLEQESILGNRLADGAQVGINESNAATVNKFKIVYPPDQSGEIEAPG